MRRTIILLTGLAIAAAVSAAPSSSANECLQYPNVPGADQIEVCQHLPVDPSDLLR